MTALTGLTIDYRLSYYDEFMKWDYKQVLLHARKRTRTYTHTSVHNHVFTSCSMEAGIVGSIPTWHGYLCVHSFWVCVVLCVGSDLETG
jgi:hypothetical protein